MYTKKKGEFVLVLGVFLAIGIFLFFRLNGEGITGSVIGILPDLIKENGSQSIINETTLNGNISNKLETTIVNNTPSSNEIDEKTTEAVTPAYYIQEANGSQCGTLSSNITLTTNVTYNASATDCFTIEARGIMIDCAGNTIFGNGSNAAITYSGTTATDFVIRNCRISGFATGINSNSNSTIQSNTIYNSTTGIQIFGGTITISRIINNTIYNTTTAILTSATTLSIISNNTITSNIDGLNINRLNLVQSNNISNNRQGAAALYADSQNNYIYNNTIGYNLQSTFLNEFKNDQFVNNTYALFLNSTGSALAESFTIRDSLFQNNVYDINLVQFRTPFNITLINSSINSSKSHVGANAIVMVRWYVNINVTDETGAGLSSANVTAYNSLSVVDYVNITNGSGFVRQEVQEKYISNDITYYLTPGTIQVNKYNYTYNTTTLNLVNKTSSVVTFVNLSISSVTCNTTLYTNFDFGNNYNCVGDGLLVGADNITINGREFSLNGSNTGAGISIASNHNIKIKNLHVWNFTTGINIFNSNNSQIQHTNLTNNQIGVVLNNSHNNSIYDTILGYNIQFRVLSTSNRTVNNTLTNVSMDFSNISTSGQSTIFYGWYADVNTTFNGLNPLSNANVTGFFNSSQVQDDTSVSSDGLARLSLTERIINSTGSTYMPPHNISLTFNYLGANIVNSTVINISLNNNTPVNLSLTLNCTAPTTTNSVSQNTTYCPGTFNVNSVTITNNNVVLECLNTILNAPNSIYGGTFLSVSGRQRISIKGCYLQGPFGYGVLISGGSSNLSLTDLTIKTTKDAITGGSAGDALACDTSKEIIINNLTFSGSGTTRDIYLYSCNNTLITRSTFNGPKTSLYFYSSNHNKIYNNSFSGVSKAIVFAPLAEVSMPSFNNTFYHNSFSSITTYYFEYYTNSEFNNSFNTSSGGYGQGNEYDNYCNQGTDLNSDGYADNSTTATAADWPYNATVAGTKISESGGNVIDSGPRIISCPPSSVQLGSSSSGGTVRGPAAASTPARAAEQPSGAPRQPPPPPPPPSETYSSASEASEFLERQVITQDFVEKNIKVTVVLENTGTKKMLLFPEIFQKIGDPFFIVTRKTLGFEGSLFTKLSALSYSRDPVAGRLLKATIVNPEQIILNPGEKIEKTIEIDEGLPIPREIKIQFTTLGETVFEEDVTVKQKAFSGTALDIDKEHQYLDIYAVIVPEELTKELEQYYAGSPTGAAVAQKGNFVGFAQQIIQQLTPKTSENQYQLELGLYEPGSSEAFFTDLYGPYDLKQNQTFIFAQQLKYNPAIYNGNYQLRTKIYRGNSLLVKNQFDVNLGEGKRGMLWPWIIVQAALVLVGGMIYFMFRSSRKRLTMKKDL